MTKQIDPLAVLKLLDLIEQSGCTIIQFNKEMLAALREIQQEAKLVVLPGRDISFACAASFTLCQRIANVGKE